MVETRQRAERTPTREELQEMEPLEVYRVAASQGFARAEHEELGITPARSSDYWPWEAVGRWIDEHSEFKGLRRKLRQGSFENSRRAVLESTGTQVPETASSAEFKLDYFRL